MFIVLPYCFTCQVLQQCNQGISDAELQEIFDQLDENGDGMLDIDGREIIDNSILFYKDDFSR